MKKQNGFTLIELVLVIIVLGVLAAVAVPKFVDLKTDADAAAKVGMIKGIQSGYTLALAKKKDFPTVDELAAQISGDVQAAATGITASLDGGTTYNSAMLTFTDDTCTTATTATTDAIVCMQEDGTWNP